MAKYCKLCEKKLGFIEIPTHTADDNIVCAGCVFKAKLGRTRDLNKSTGGVFKIDKTADEIRERIKRVDNNMNVVDPSFIATKKIGTLIEFDESSKRIFIPEDEVFIDYSDVIGFELLEDDKTKISGGLGGAVAGGILFGAVGAIVGGVAATREVETVCNSLKVKITINNMDTPALFIDFLCPPVQTPGIQITSVSKTKKEYEEAFTLAHECVSVLQLICEMQKDKAENM